MVRRRFLKTNRKGEAPAEPRATSTTHAQSQISHRKTAGCGHFVCGLFAFA